MKPYFNLKYWQQRWGAFPVFIVMIIAVVLVVYLAYLAGVWHAKALKQEVSEQEQQLDQLYQRLEQMEYQRHVLQVELDIERSANQSLQDELSVLQNDNYGLRRDLAFYQKIMAPELQEAGVIIDSLTITPNRSENHFHFSLALLQIEQRRNFVQGNVTVELVGRTAGDKKRYNLLDLANLGKDDRSFSMRYFSLYEGDFLMPEGLVPERVEVKVRVTKGGNGTLERTFFWKDINRSDATPSVRSDGNT
ncbi:DUF6776 family protein [Idiomarina aminovorans]|uniref:DUF6776 family protein n=1 Tax=Idiomarina aminovorans TaxID=2914829 RepID=UPI0020042C96|nr:DUF6776 family protein [Idiomarina sp. ATCH4]MCK7459623.1 hypothetical protein [Idiomarina sp. ATCH4]